MKKFKRISAALLAGVMCFSLASCEFADTETEITNGSIKIGVVIPGKQELKGDEANDLSTIVTLNSINSLTGEGYGVDGERFHYSENIDPNDADAVKNGITSLVNIECNMIILADGGYSDDVVSFAEENPDVQFLVNNYTGQTTPEGNIHSYSADIAGAQFLSGYVAGLKAAELKKDIIGFLVQNNNNLANLNAFADGVKSSNLSARINAKVCNDVKADAAALIDRTGCSIIAADFYSDDLDDVAIEKNVFFCGFGTDQYKNSEANKDAQSKILCASAYNYEQYFINAVKAIVDNSEANKTAETEEDLIPLTFVDCKGNFASGNTYLTDINPVNAAKGTNNLLVQATASATTFKANPTALTSNTVFVNF